MNTHHTHRCFERILEQLYCIQQAGGLDLFATLTGCEEDRQLRRWQCSVAVILGDTLANDVLCGRFVYHGCTPVDIVHTLPHGIYKYSMETVLQAEVEAALMTKTEDDRKEGEEGRRMVMFHGPYEDINSFGVPKIPPGAEADWSHKGVAKTPLHLCE
jgi:hypothetical protein